jgi:type IV pilus assembly protein PilA
MFYRLRQRLNDESGFTLIELLVVILIIGILAAIAIPAFLNQKGKANDAAAKSQARTAQTAMETFNTDHSTYVGATKGELQVVEPTLKDTSGATLEETSALTTTGYTVTSKSPDGTTFSISRNGSGEVSRACKLTAATANHGGCNAAAEATEGTW